MKKYLLIFCWAILLCAKQAPVNVAENSEQQDTKEDSKTPPTIAQSKSGFVIGIEALFGSSTTYNDVQSSQNFSLMGGFYGGYQHYFDDNFGIRALLSIHDGTPIMGEFNIQNQQIKTSALPFWVGTELDILWDFWQQGEHVLGVSAGLGYNFELYHSREAKVNNVTQNLSQLYQHNLYPIFGLHYYYGHHQMSLNYRFIGTVGTSSKKEMIGESLFQMRYSFADYLNFSYTYRF